MTGESEGMDYRVETVAKLDGIPWGMVLIAPQRLLVTLREGRLFQVDLNGGRIKPIAGLPKILVEGQGGLLDIARPPRSEGQEWIYFTYSKSVSGGGATTLARAKLSGLQLSQWQELLVTRSVTSTGRHFGSRIAFDGAGHLFFSIGDRGERPNGQDLRTHAGSILRLNLDGSVPADNPFVADPQALDEIWSYGHRNPQGVVFDPRAKRLWAIEHGPRGGDEINLIQPGRNYGWPVISYGKEYWGPFKVGEGERRAGMEQPVKYYVPSIAPGSLLLYSGNAFPAWNGSLFAGALAMRHLNRVEIDPNGKAIGEERLLGELDERIRALLQADDGAIILSTDSGILLRITPR